MKKLFALVLALAGAVMGLRAESTALVVDLADGSTAKFLLSDRPVISYTATDMVVTAPEGKFSYTRGDVARITFAESTQGIADAAASALNFALEGSKLTIFGATPAEVKAYDLAGRQISPAVSAEGEATVLDFSSCGSATYVISIANHPSLKIQIK